MKKITLLLCLVLLLSLFTSCSKKTYNVEIKYEDGTTTIGIWFKPLPDDVAHMISKKYKLYRD